MHSFYYFKYQEKNEKRTFSTSINVENINKTTKSWTDVQREMTAGFGAIDLWTAQVIFLSDTH